MGMKEENVNAIANGVKQLLGAVIDVVAKNFVTKENEENSDPKKEDKVTTDENVSKPDNK
jgi:hypothetical protein